MIKKFIDKLLGKPARAPAIPLGKRVEVGPTSTASTRACWTIARSRSSRR